MRKVTWRRFNQSAKQLVVGQTTIPYDMPCGTTLILLHSRPHPSQAGARFSDPGGMQGWADVEYYTLCVSCEPTAYATVHCILSIDLLSLPNSSMHRLPGRVLPTLLIGTKYNRSSTRVKDMDTVHPIYLILTICVPHWRSTCSIKFQKSQYTYYIHYYHPPPISHTQRYGLRPRVHDRTLPERKSNLVDCNFIIRMLYLNAYWLNIGLRYKYVIFLLYVVAISLIVCQNALCHFVY